MSSLMKDHPHACGEKPKCCGELHSDGGSSPRVWGKVYVLPFTIPIKRIIPTRVGKSDDFEDEDGIGEDHPHACGEKGLYTSLWTT